MTPFDAFASSTVAPPGGGGDKYSALAMLDTEFGKPEAVPVSQPVQPPAKVEWNAPGLFCVKNTELNSVEWMEVSIFLFVLRLFSTCQLGFECTSYAQPTS